MKHKIRATWVSRKERSIWCLDFAGLSKDRERLRQEIEASDDVIRQQAEDSLLVAVVLDQSTMAPEVEEFFRVTAARPRNPIHKMAVLGLSDFQRFWYRWIHRVAWPTGTRFLDDYERAKDWLVGETF